MSLTAAENDLLSAYAELTDARVFVHDPAQAKVLGRLQELGNQLVRGSSSFARMLLGTNGSGPKGVYLWGGAGGGKSMLMDLFFQHVKTERKRRVHFHAFMQDVHAAIHTARKSGAPDAIKTISAGIAHDLRLLCFDELQINDITDAMIVGRLFEALLAAGVIIVATSNSAPVALYKDGLNRQLFLPFIDTITARMNVYHLDNKLDYRQHKLARRGTYFVFEQCDAASEISATWKALSGGTSDSLTLHVNSRDVVVPMFSNGVGRVTFADLCDAPLGAADYLAIAAALRVLIMEDIPQLDRGNYNAARRFVILIDTLYEAKVRLICSAAAVPEKLFKDGPSAFEFKRTASRLREMQSVDWGVYSGSRVM